jgi:hypothetical protein
MKQYWATLEGEELATAIRLRVARAQRHYQSTGLWWLWVKAHALMQGMGKDGYTSHSLEKKGRQGEYTSFNVNHYRSIVRHYRNLAAGQRPSMDPLAETGEAEAETQTRKAKTVLEHYAREGWEDVQVDVTWFASVLGAGWELKWWNALRGKPVLPPEDVPPLPGEPPPAPMYAGDFEFHAFKPNDVYFDPALKTVRKIPWVVFRLKASRWDLAADFPERAEEIASLRRNTIDTDCDFAWTPGLQQPDAQHDEDMVSLFVFVHDARPACPDGRFALCLSTGAPLIADALPAGIFSARVLHDGDMLDSAHGYANLWDIMGLQEYVNMAASIRASNQRAHGVSVIATPKGSDIDASQISKGLTLLKYNPPYEPKPINFTSTPPEVTEGQKAAVEDMGLISGVNSVQRGDPQASLRTGPALALVKASGVEASLDFQTSLSRYYTKSAEDLLALFQEFATEPVQIEVLGDSGTLRSAVGGEDVSLVSRVRVDMGSPLSKTLAGKTELATQLVQLAAQNGTPLDFGQYLRVLETGRTEPLTELDTKKRRNIQRENEMLAKARFIPGPVDPMTGQPTQVLDPSVPMPRALGTDDVRLHIPWHLSQLDSPEARANPAVAKAVLAHVMEHIQSATQIQMGQPLLLEAMGYEPLASVMGMAAAAGAPQEGPAGPQKGPASATQPKLPGAQAEQQGVNPEAPGPGGVA